MRCSAVGFARTLIAPLLVSCVWQTEPVTIGGGEPLRIVASGTDEAPAGPTAAVPEQSPSAPRAAAAEASANGVLARADAIRQRHPYHAEMGELTLPKDAPAMRFANLSPAVCRQRLGQLDLELAKVNRATPGVANPRRLDGSIRGVRYTAPGGGSPFGVLDCRLLLTLYEWSEWLREQGVVAVRVDNFYRPGAKLARKRKPSQHSYGLAMDVMGLTLEDGTELDVERDWGDPIGATVCGPEARASGLSSRGVQLRNLVCETGRLGFFHHILTPSYNAAHRDHLHLDIQRDAPRRFLQ